MTSGDRISSRTATASIYVRDLADVVVGPEPRQGFVSGRQGEAVAGIVLMLKGVRAGATSSRT